MAFIAAVFGERVELKSSAIRVCGADPQSLVRGIDAWAYPADIFQGFLASVCTETGIPSERGVQECIGFI